MSGKNNDFLLAGVLLVGAYMFTRQAGAVQVRPGGSIYPNSMPGNAGTSIGNALGGALGKWLGGMFTGSSSGGGFSPNVDGVSGYSGNPVNLNDQLLNNPDLYDNFTQYGV
jgi:hypothetical protein